MTWLLKCFVILLQNHQPVSLSKYVQTQNFNSSPPIFPTRSHRVHLDLASAKTLTDRIHRFGSRPHRDGLANSLLPCCNYFVHTENCNWYHRDSSQTLCCLIASLWSHRVDAIGATETQFCPSHYTSLHPSCFSQCHRDS